MFTEEMKLTCVITLSFIRWRVLGCFHSMNYLHNMRWGVWTLCPSLTPTHWKKMKQNCDALTFCLYPLRKKKGWRRRMYCLTVWGLYLGHNIFYWHLPMEGTILTVFGVPIQIGTPHLWALTQIPTPQCITEILIANPCCLDSLCYCTESNTPFSQI